MLTLFRHSPSVPEIQRPPGSHARFEKLEKICFLAPWSSRQRLQHRDMGKGWLARD